MKQNLKGFIKQNWLLMIAAIYVLSPIDILPDVIPFFGSVDDTIVVLLELVRQYWQYSKENKGVDTE